jgi:hypothetical protein
MVPGRRARRKSSLAKHLRTEADAHRSGAVIAQTPFAHLNLLERLFVGDHRMQSLPAQFGMLRGWFVSSTLTCHDTPNSVRDRFSGRDSRFTVGQVIFLLSRCRYG